MWGAAWLVGRWVPVLLGPAGMVTCVRVVKLIQAPKQMVASKPLAGSRP